MYNMEWDESSGHFKIDGMTNDEYEASMQDTSEQDLIDLGIINQPKEDEAKDFTPSQEDKEDLENNSDASTWQEFENALDYETRQSGLEYEKLGALDTAKDVGKALGNEISHLWKRKKDYDGAFSFLNALPEEQAYNERTHFAENVKYFYRYGSWLIPFVGWGKAVNIATKVPKLTKFATRLAKTTKFVNGEFGIFEKGGWLGKFVGKGVAGLPLGAVADVTNYREYDEGNMQLADIFGETDNPFIKYLQSDYDDTGAEMAYKRVLNGMIAGFGLGSVGGTVAESIFKTAKNMKNIFKKGDKATKAEVQALDIQMEKSEKVSEKAQLIAQTEAAYKEAQKQGATDIERFIREQKFVNAGNQADVLDILEKLQKEQTIKLNENGTFSIEVNKWQDAANVSIDELKAQTGNDGIKLMDNAVKDVWVERGWLAADEEIIKRDIKTDKVTVNTKAVNRIKDNYLNKWEIDNKVDVEFVEGKVNGSDGTTQTLEYKGKIVKDKQNAIDKKKLQIKELEDKITMAEGGNGEITDPLDVLKEKLRIAQNELKTLTKEPKKLSNIKILINKNAENPYAILRSELEHARDIAKGEVPKDKHFSRYEGANESEMSLGYVKKKADTRAGKNIVQEPNEYKVPSVSENMDDFINNPERQEALVRAIINDEAYKAEGLLDEFDNTYIRKMSDEDISLNKDTVSYLELDENNDIIGIKVNTNLPKEEVEYNILHELKHVQQAKNPELAKQLDKLNEISKNVKTEEDYLKYKNHPLEKEADEYASSMIQKKKDYYGQRGNERISDEKVENKRTGSTSTNGRVQDSGRNSQVRSGEIKSDTRPIEQRLSQAKTTYDIHQAVAEIVAQTAKGEHDWKVSAESADKVYNFLRENGWTNLASIKEAFSRGDVDFVNQVVHLQQAGSKLLRDLSEQLVNTEDVKKIEELTDALKYLTDWMDDLGSAYGRGLNEQSFLKKCKSYWSLTSIEQEGGQSFVDALYATVKSYNFTTGKDAAKEIYRALNKQYAEMMQALMKSPEVFDMFDYQFQQALKKVGNPKNLTKEQLNDIVTGLLKDAQLRACKEYLLEAAPDALNKAIKNMDKNAIWQGIGSYHVNNLLSSTGVQLRNIFEGLFQTYAMPIEKWFGGCIDTIIGNIAHNDQFLTGGSAKMKEAMYTYSCINDSVKDAWLAGVRAWKVGKGTLSHLGKEAASDNNTLTRLIELGNINPFENLSKDDTLSQKVLKSVWWATSPMLRFMGASDEFITHLNYRAITKAKAMVQAEALVSDLKGAERKAALKEQASKISDLAFDEKGHPLDSQAYYEAREIVLQAPLTGKVWNYSDKSYHQIRPQTLVMSTGSYLQREMHPSLRLFFRFIGTPTNMMQQTIDHNVFLSIFSPAQRELLKGTSQQSVLARGRIVTGALAFSTMWGLLSTCANRITGNYPNDADTRSALIKAGWQPYSIRLGDKWYSYRNIEPLHSILGFVADSHTLVNSYTTDETKGQNLTKYMLSAGKILYDNFLDKASFMNGMEQMTAITELLENPDEAKAQNMLANQLKGLLPLAGLGQEIGKWGDSSKRKPKTLYDKVFNKYFNQGLGDFRRNIWGERQDVYQNALAFIKSTDVQDKPEDIELIRLAEKGFSPTELLDGESEFTFKWSNFMSEGHSQSLYSLMLRRMGDIELDGKTLREAVRDCVESEEYQLIPIDGTTDEARAMNAKKFTRKDETKINMLKDIFDDYRKQAVTEILDEYGDEYFDKNGVSANEIKELQINNKEEYILNQDLSNDIESIRSFN